MGTEPIDAGNSIAPISPPEKPAIDTIAPAQAMDKPRPATPRDEVKSAGGDTREPVKTRASSSDATRPRGDIVELAINLDDGRVALSTADGPPYRGYVDTDLPPGAYWLTPQRSSNRWIFQRQDVKTGLRFTLWIDGPDPFSLPYANPLLLVAGSGLGNARLPDFDAVVKSIVDMIHDATEDQHLEAIGLLCLFAEPDLYDIVDALWTRDPGLVNALLLGMTGKFQGKDLEGLSAVIRALESFARPPKDLYIDSFSRWSVHPDSFKAPNPKESARRSNIQLLLEFDLFPPRAVIIYADDISDSTETDANLPRYGASNLTYPRILTKGTTPRLHAAKKDAWSLIETQNAEFITQSFKAVAVVLLSVFQAGSAVAKLAASPPFRGPVPGRLGPGRWQPTFEAGSNMSEAAERYELTSCGTPRGMGYYVDGVQFEGFANGRLLDAKFWQAGGYIGRGIRNGWLRVGWKITDQAERQLAVAGAHGVGVEWRVADPWVADALRAIFQANRLPINVVHIAP